MERSLPKVIDYSVPGMPRAVPAIQRRRKFYPTNANEFGPGFNNEIRIDLESSNSLLDPSNSYLDFEFVNTDAAQSVGFDNSDQVFFDELRIEQNGRVLSKIQGYNRLNCSVLSMGQQTHNARVGESIYGGARGFNQDAAANNLPEVAPAALPVTTGPGTAYTNLNHNGALIGPALTQRFSVQIQGGLFTQDKMIPLPLVKGPITIVLILTTAQNIGAWTAAPAPATAYRLRNVSYVASLIEVGRDVIDQFRAVQDAMGGQLVISSQDWEYNTEDLAALATGQHIFRLPARHRSIKSVFWNANSTNMANAAAANLSVVYNMSYAGGLNATEQQLRIGSQLYPAEPIRLAGGVAGLHPAQRGEGAMELAKAFGSLGWTSPTGQFSTVGYGTSPVVGGPNNGDMGAGGVNCVGTHNTAIQGYAAAISCDSWQNEAIEGGADSETLAEQANLLITIDPAGNSGAEVKTINMWVLFDQHYYFRSDGSITFSN
jgi:hypothetical protein